MSRFPFNEQYDLTGYGIFESKATSCVILATDSLAIDPTGCDANPYTAVSDEYLRFKIKRNDGPNTRPSTPWETEENGLDVPQEWGWNFTEATVDIGEYIEEGIR